MRDLPTRPSALLTILFSGAVLSACSGPSEAGKSDATPLQSAGVLSAPAATTLAGTASTARTAESTPPAVILTPPAPAPAMPPPVILVPPPAAPGPAPAPSLPPAPQPVLPPPTTLPPPQVPGVNVVTEVRVQNLKSVEQSAVPLTFGQVFAVGQVTSAQTVNGKLGDGTVVPLQVDVKARHPDGSVRHAILSAKLARLAAGQSAILMLEKVPAHSAAPAATPAALLEAGFSAAVHATLNGERYSASADALLRSGKYTSWLAGPVANEWLLAAPLTTAQGKVHPHLSARFAIRAFDNKQARVDVTLENAWAFEPGPQNFQYAAEISVGGQKVFSKDSLNHLHHARWRKVFWWGSEPAVHIRHNTAYLIASGALPNFDQGVRFSEANLNALVTEFTSKGRNELMAVGLANPYMPSTGGRNDIGLLPGWGATYLLSMDKRAKDVTLGTADLAGSWSMHYRDRNTDRPVSIVDFPYMTILGISTDTVNTLTKKPESFPICPKELCVSPNAHDTSHQPAFAYLPYLVTGDYYYLEELQFWTMFNAFSSNPGYREFAKGLVKPDQVRGQAWSMRTLAEAAYISPTDDPLKKQFEGFLQNNIDWYDTNYTKAANNKLGVLTHGYAVAYENWTGMSPWMDDFFTAAIGHVVELGYTKALPLLKWKAAFPVARMTDPEFCWIKGGIYALKIRDAQTAPIYATLGKAYGASVPADFKAMACNSPAMAASLGLKVGEMTGYSGSVTGFPSNMQPALAYAADVSGAAGALAWSKFMARSVKPNYSDGPQFAIIPR